MLGQGGKGRGERGDNALVRGINGIWTWDQVGMEI